MRKIYWRRVFLPSFILTIISMFFLVFTTMYNNKQDSIASFIYNTQANCVDSQGSSFIPPSIVPPHYLVVPYREFALRTSIACRMFKLDNPKENQAKLHPKYSKYLRGRFPYVIPDKSITFEDVENLYTNLLPAKESDDSPVEASYANNITFQNIPYEFHDGMWNPVGVKSAQRTALFVPLQGREYNAKAFLLNMHAFLRRQQLTYTIILVEQVSPLGNRFNKGRLFNTAILYLQEQSLDIDCIILHDVDLIPEDDGNFYVCEPTHPKHTTSRVRQLDSTRGYTRYYEFLIGGVLLLTFDMYKSLNGFSNSYWGWGGEDDDLALRLIQQRMCIVRPSYDLAIYVGLPHPRGKRNDARFGLLAWATIRRSTDGYDQIKSLTRIVDISQTSTVIHLKVDVDANQSLNKPSSRKILSSSSNSSGAGGTVTKRTILRTTTARKKK